MKKKGLPLMLGIIMALSFTACGNLKKTTEQTPESETETRMTEKKTEKATEKETTKETAEKASEKQTEQVPEAVTQPEVSEPAQTTEAPQTEAEYPGSVQSPSVYEEDYKQCPYCSEWFSAQPDNDLWNAYDRHMLEEREKHEGGQETEQEMVQCPDCLNWYEAGNIFRNHICTGRE